MYQALEWGKHLNANSLAFEKTNFIFVYSYNYILMPMLHYRKLI